LKFKSGKFLLGHAIRHGDHNKGVNIYIFTWIRDLRQSSFKAKILQHHCWFNHWATVHIHCKNLIGFPHSEYRQGSLPETFLSGNSHTSLPKYRQTRIPELMQKNTDSWLIQKITTDAKHFITGTTEVAYNSSTVHVQVRRPHHPLCYTIRDSMRCE